MDAPKPPKILIVDDDARLRDLLGRYLTEQGFNVQLAEHALAMDRMRMRERFDLLVLDLMLPGEDGLAICRRLRAVPDRTPINPRELVARIHAVLRRRAPPELPSAPSEQTEIFKFGDFTLNLATRALTKNGQEVPLTTSEFALLKVFARAPRQPLSRDKLTELARGREYEVFDRSLDVQISRLRKLIEQDSGNPRFIQTVWGLGYVFIPN